MTAAARGRRLASIRSAVLLALLAALVSTGCKENAMVKNEDTDKAFIRLPGDQPSTLRMGDGAIFPITKGSEWYLVTPTKDGYATEHVTAVGPTTVDGVTGQALVTTVPGTPERTDIYKNDSDGISLMAAGSGDDLMRMSPPIPLLSLPLTDGQYLKWSGILHYKNSSSFGTSLSRISSRDHVTTHAGPFNAYRVDTIITTTIAGHPASFPVTRWFSPGVGLIRQRVLSGNKVVTWDLKSYRPAAT